MPNTTNYAQVWEKELLAITVQNTLTSPFITDKVNWLDAKTFHFTQMATSGFRNHTVGGAFKRGVYTQTDKPYTLEHDRDIEFLIDKREVDESNATASIENVSKVFEKTKAAPEVDARFYEKVYEAANTNGRAVGKEIATYTKETILADVKNAIKKCKKYRGSLIAYVRDELMDLLELALGDKAKIQWTTISDYKFSIETRVAMVDGVPLMEVVDQDRFCTKFDYLDSEAGGFTKNGGGKQINILVASTETCKTVKKIQSIYYFAPGSHPLGDGYLYQRRDHWDTFVFPNGADGLIDSVYVEYDSTL